MKLFMDLMDKYFKGCSPYIYSYTYDIDKREVLLTCAKSTYEWVPFKQLKFIDVLSFSEEIIDKEDAYDDSLIDSVIGIDRDPNGVYFIATEKREHRLTVGAKPIGQIISE